LNYGAVENEGKIKTFSIKPRPASTSKNGTSNATC